MMKTDKPYHRFPLLLALLMGWLLTACSVESRRELLTPDDLPNCRLCVQLGSSQDSYVTDTYPLSDIYRAKYISTMFAMLQNRRTDVIFVEYVEQLSYKHKFPQLYVVDSLKPSPVVAMFKKGANAELREAFNGFLEKIRLEGTLRQMHDDWFNDDGTHRIPYGIPFYTQGRPIRVGSPNEIPVFCFYRNNQMAGFENELLMRFAAYMKRPIEFYNVKLDGLIEAVDANSIDIGYGCLDITEARRQQVDFSDSYAETMTVGLSWNHRLDGLNADGTHASFWSRVKRSFTNNIIAEGRYMLIYNGLIVTLVIVAISAFFGTLLGFLICWLRMCRFKVCNWVAGCYVQVVKGLPILVFLMIMYYIVLAWSNLNSMMVASITFSLHFAAYVADMMQVSINRVDRGQREAGIALGFSEMQTLFYVILPQAAKKVRPQYKQEFILLVKNTSIAAYIAVENLVRASDIIRTRTFEAFFPLLIISVIYFLLVWIIASLLDLITREKKTE